MDASGATASQQVPLTAVERAYRHVKAEILSRRVEPNDFLSEGQIAAAVGVSRTPVREAFLRLETEGVLRLLPKRGALVLPVTAEQVQDLLETRRLIETFAVRKVITAGSTAPLVAALRRHLQDMRAALSARDLIAYVSADRDFHAEIVTAAGNTILSDVYHSLRDRQLRMGAVNLLDESGGERAPAASQARMRATLADHEQIAAAIENRRLRAAEAAVEGHLEHTERVLGTRR